MEHRKQQRDACVNIVKQGYLFIKRPPKNGFIRFKSWHRRYFVLRDESLEHPSRLEMYQKEGDFSKNHTRLILHLDKVIHVGRAEDSKRFRQAFMVVCAGRSPILLAEEDAMYLNSWLLAVTLIAEKRSDHHQGQDDRCAGCREFRRSFSGGGDCGGGGGGGDCPPAYFNDPASFDDGSVRRYEVSAESTSTSRRNGIEGDYVLSVRPWGLSLSKGQGGEQEEDYTLPLGYIRKFKSESLPHSYYKRRYYVLTLELGRRCATGEGILQFHTVHGKEIIADMNAAICRSMTTKLLPEEGAPCKRGLTRSRQSLSLGSSQGSYCIGPGWRAKDSSSSLNIKTSVSRQSSGGNTSVSRLTFSMDHEGPYANGAPRSPLLSDSSGDARFRIGTDAHSLTSSSSSSSSATSRSSASGESGQYVEAEFNPDSSSSPRRLSLNVRRCHSNSSGGGERGKTQLDGCENGETEVTEEKKSFEDKVAKAAAEGYLEVLPDLFSGGKSLETSAQDELLSIYHVLDFSKPNNVVRHQSVGCLGVNEPGGGKAKLRSPRSSLADCSPDLNDVIENNGSLAHLRKLSGSGRKPPAPLPRPEHTMLPK